jgi:AbrB family looped-hinge helix DNA binding protein
MATETVVIGESGRIVLPAAIRKRHDLKPGDRLTVIDTEHGIRLVSMNMAIEELRAGIIAHRGSLEGLLDEFLQERRAEARREAEGE